MAYDTYDIDFSLFAVLEGVVGVILF